MDYELKYLGKEPQQNILKQTIPAILIELERFGQQNGQWTNRLIMGDSLNVLKTLSTYPEIYGRVKMVYIDPPFSTKQIFETKQLWYRNDNNGTQHAYADEQDGATFIEYIRKRLIFLREILDIDGSMYVHLDNNMAFEIKTIMDEIFGRKNFRSWITRQKCSTKNYTKNVYGNISDYIMFYTKSDDYIWNRPYQEWDEQRIRKEYNRIDKKTGRRYKLVPIHAQGQRNGTTGKPWKNLVPPPGKHWQYTPDKLDELDRRGEIYWSPTGNPRKIVYLDPDSKGIPMQDIWTEFRDSINQNTIVTEYPTEKNIDLIKLLISTSSNEGDIILDAFVGSGTTCYAAAELQRRWIGIDSSNTAIDIAKERLKNLRGKFESLLQPCLDSRHYIDYSNFIVLKAQY